MRVGHLSKTCATPHESKEKDGLILWMKAHLLPWGELLTLDMLRIEPSCNSSAEIDSWQQWELDTDHLETLLSLDESVGREEALKRQTGRMVWPRACSCQNGQRCLCSNQKNLVESLRVADDGPDYWGQAWLELVHRFLHHLKHELAREQPFRRRSVDCKKEPPLKEKDASGFPTVPALSQRPPIVAPKTSSDTMLENQELADRPETSRGSPRGRTTILTNSDWWSVMMNEEKVEILFEEAKKGVVCLKSLPTSLSFSETSSTLWL